MLSALGMELELESRVAELGLELEVVDMLARSVFWTRRDCSFGLLMVGGVCSDPHGPVLGPVTLS